MSKKTKAKKARRTDRLHWRFRSEAVFDARYLVVNFPGAIPLEELDRNLALVKKVHDMHDMLKTVAEKIENDQKEREDTGGWALAEALGNLRRLLNEIGD